MGSRSRSPTGSASSRRVLAGGARAPDPSAAPQRAAPRARYPQPLAPPRAAGRGRHPRGVCDGERRVPRRRRPLRSHHAHRPAAPGAVRCTAGAGRWPQPRPLRAASFLARSASLRRLFSAVWLTPGPISFPMVQREGRDGPHHPQRVHHERGAQIEPATRLGTQSLHTLSVSPRTGGCVWFAAVPVRADRLDRLLHRRDAQSPLQPPRCRQSLVTVTSQPSPTPAPRAETWRPDSFYDRIAENRKVGLHTLCLLDIRVKEPSVEALCRRARRPTPRPRRVTPCDVYRGRRLSSAPWPAQRPEGL